MTACFSYFVQELSIVKLAGCFHEPIMVHRFYDQIFRQAQARILCVPAAGHLFFAALHIPASLSAGN
jgi:hypothetical protein